MATGCANPVCGVESKHGNPSDAQASRERHVTTGVLDACAVPLKQGHRTASWFSQVNPRRTLFILSVLAASGRAWSRCGVRAERQRTSEVGSFQGKAPPAAKGRRGVSIERRKPPNPSLVRAAGFEGASERVAQSGCQRIAAPSPHTLESRNSGVGARHPHKH
jgi:hypothetical protein